VICFVRIASIPLMDNGENKSLDGSAAEEHAAAATQVER
jgi:hypothetical protein